MRAGPIQKKNSGLACARGTTGFRISSMVVKILESGILTFINILVKLCIYPYIVNHMIWIALFGIQESLESSQESWNQARNLGILPRFRITSKKIHSVGPLGLASLSATPRIVFWGLAINLDIKFLFL